MNMTFRYSHNLERTFHPLIAKIFLLRLVLFLSLCIGFHLAALCQAPQLIPYQAIARDNNGLPVTNQAVGLRFSIRQTSVTGPIEWQEVQEVLSNQLGVINTQLGLVITLSNVNWGGGIKFLQVEMDISGGTNYLDMGTQQMMSVPYALYAESSGTPGTPGPNGLNSLIKQSQENPGANCTNGGVKIETGLDINNNNVLDQAEINSSQTQFVCNGQSTQSTLQIGDTLEGGIVFYIDESGQHGLMMAPSNFNITGLNFCLPDPWFGYGQTVFNIGSGEFNTRLLGLQCEQNSVVNSILNATIAGHSDWFIPSRDEFLLIRMNISILGTSALPDANYITSSFERFYKPNGYVNNQNWGIYSFRYNTTSTLQIDYPFSFNRPLDAAFLGIYLGNNYAVRPIRKF